MMNPDNIIYIAGAILGVIIVAAIVHLLTLPFVLMFKLAINGIFGAIMLYFINMIGIINLKITLIHCLIAGTFGIPGVIGLIIYNQFLK